MVKYSSPCASAKPDSTGPARASHANPSVERICVIPNTHKPRAMPIRLNRTPPSKPPTTPVHKPEVLATMPIWVLLKPRSRQNEVDNAVAILSPSLYKQMKASTSSARRHPQRAINSRKGITTASPSVLGGAPARVGSLIKKVINMPGSRQAAVITKTADHGSLPAARHVDD